MPEGFIDHKCKRVGVGKGADEQKKIKTSVDRLNVFWLTAALKKNIELGSFAFVEQDDKFKQRFTKRPVINNNDNDDFGEVIVYLARLNK